MSARADEDHEGPLPGYAYQDSKIMKLLNHLYEVWCRVNDMGSEKSGC
jgi:hypothetical protein